MRVASSQRLFYSRKTGIKAFLHTNQLYRNIFKVLKTDAPIVNCPGSFPRPSDQLYTARQKNMNKLSGKSC